jgi:hypothetical protein
LAEEEGRRLLPPPRRPCRLWPWPFAATEPGRLYLNGAPGICTSFFWIFYENLIWCPILYVVIVMNLLHFLGCCLCPW